VCVGLSLILFSIVVASFFYLMPTTFRMLPAPKTVPIADVPFDVLALNILHSLIVYALVPAVRLNLINLIDGSVDPSDICMAESSILTLFAIPSILRDSYAKFAYL